MSTKQDEMTMSDDSRIVTVSVATLKAYEAAVRHRESMRLATARAADVLEVAKVAYERAVVRESDAIDAEIAATRALHGEQPTESKL